MNNRIHTRVSVAAMLRLAQAVECRSSENLDRVSQGKILDDLIMGKIPNGLPPHPTERKRVSRARVTARVEKSAA